MHTGVSPSQLFLCRVQRTKLEVLPELCHINTTNAIQGADAKKAAHKSLCEKRSGKELKPLSPGQRVLIQQLRGVSRKPRWDNLGTIAYQNGDRPSYYVDLDSGGRLLRNRVYLRN